MGSEMCHTSMGVNSGGTRGARPFHFCQKLPFDWRYCTHRRLWHNSTMYILSRCPDGLLPFRPNPFRPLPFPFRPNQLRNGYCLKWSLDEVDSDEMIMDEMGLDKMAIARPDRGPPGNEWTPFKHPASVSLDTFIEQYWTNTDTEWHGTQEHNVHQYERCWSQKTSFCRLNKDQE